MNPLKRILILLTAAATLILNVPFTASSANAPDPLKGYMIGNSLTGSISPARLDALFKTQYYDLELGIQAGAGVTLGEHLGLRSATDPDNFIPWLRPFDGTIRTTPMNLSTSASLPGMSPSISNKFCEALSAESFDFMSLQPYMNLVDTPSDYAGAETESITVDNTDYTGDYYQYYHFGDRQAIGTIINYALDKKQKLGKGADKFIVYQTWPDVNGISQRNYDPDGNGICTFSEFFEAPYDSSIRAKSTTPSIAQTNLLMTELMQDFPPELSAATIRLAPVGEIMARIDREIINGTLTGIESYFNRNADYYITSRAKYAEIMPAELVENAYVQKYGAINLYVDNIHMAAWPHSSAEDGTLASYISAITMYSVITGNSPVGLPVNMQSQLATEQYGRIDPVEDAALINKVQEIVFDVLTNSEHSSRYTGVTLDAPSRVTPELLIQNSFSLRDPQGNSLPQETATSVSGTNVYTLNNYSSNNEMSVWQTKNMTSDTAVSGATISLSNNNYKPYNDWIKVGTWLPSIYLMQDITAKLRVTDTYRLSVQVKNSGDADTVNLCLKLTKKNGDTEKLYIGRCAADSSSFTTVSGAYIHRADVVKTEVFIEMQNAASPNPSANYAYYLDNFELLKIATGEGYEEPEQPEEPTLPISVIKNTFSYSTSTTANSVCTVPNESANGETIQWYIKSSDNNTNNTGGASIGINWNGYMKFSPWSKWRYAAADVTQKLKSGRKYKANTAVKLNTDSLDKVSLILRLTMSDNTFTDQEIALGTSASKDEFITFGGEFEYLPSDDVTTAEFFLKPYKSANPDEFTLNYEIHIDDFELLEYPETKTKNITLTVKTVQNEKITVEAANPNAKAVSGILAIAAYSSDNRLTAIELHHIDLYANASDSVNSDIVLNGKVLITAFDTIDNIKPISEALKY